MKLLKFAFDVSLVALGAHILTAVAYIDLSHEPLRIAAGGFSLGVGIISLAANDKRAC